MKRQGFSLLEMLIGIAVLAIMLAIGALSLRTPSSQTFANDARSLLYKARLEAAKRNRPVAVVWDSAQQVFTVRYSTSSLQASSACSATTISETLSGSDYRKLNVSASFSGDGLVWLPNGLVTTCGGLPQAASILANDAQGSRIIAISITGMVTVQ